jgi:hypothetical protein
VERQRNPDAFNALKIYFSRSKTSSRANTTHVQKTVVLGKIHLSGILHAQLRTDVMMEMQENANVNHLSMG